MAAVRLALLALFITNSIHAQETLRSRSKNNINLRQTVVQTPPPSAGQPELPSDYWWPFPQTSNPLPSIAVTATLPGDPSLGTAIVSNSISDVTMITTSQDLSSSSSQFSSSSSMSMITITAVPSASTSLGKTYPKLTSAEEPEHARMKILLPICITLGIALGAFTTWLTCGCIKRKPRLIDYTYTGIENQKTMNFDGTTYDLSKKVATQRWGGGRRRRESELEVGPQYCELVDQDEDEKRDVEKELSPPPLKKVVSSQSNVSRPFAWPSITAVLTPTKSSNTSSEGRNARKQGILFSPAETDITSFLSPLPNASKREDSELLRKPTTPWESLRHKSIKRGILSEVRNDEVVRARRASGFAPTTPSAAKDRELLTSPDSSFSGDEAPQSLSRRQGHTRATSDVHLDGLVDSPILARASKGPPMVKEDTTSSDVTLNRKSTTKGFRMMVESPPALGTSKFTRNTSSDSQSRYRPRTESLQGAPEVSDGSISRALAWAASPFTAEEADRFTPAPGRRNSSPDKKRSQTDPKPQPKFGHRIALPQSPSLASSPTVDSRLCFSPSLTGNNFSIAQHHAASKQDRPLSASPQKPVDDRRKLRSKSPPRLPFPSGKAVAGPGSPRPGTTLDAAEVYRGRLVKKDVSKVGKKFPVYKPVSPSLGSSNSEVHERVKEILGRG